MKKLLVFLLIFLGYCTAFSQDSLHFTFPTNEALFIAGSDTLITWEGISPTDSVSIAYSTDNGKSWLIISQKAVGLNYLWKNIPKKLGEKYLLRLIHKGEIITILDEPIIEWQNTYGGSSSDFLADIRELSEGGYIAVGSSQSSDFDIPVNKGKSDIWLLKVDSIGNKIFSKTYGGSKIEEGYFVRQTSDKGYLIGGSASSQDYDFTGSKSLASQCLIKCNKNGDLEWQKTYSYSFLWNPFLDIQETEDGGFILIGDTGYVHTCADPRDWGGSHIYILKIDKTGNYEWSKTYGGNFGEVALSLEKAGDGGYVVSGSTSSKCGEIINTHDVGEHFYNSDAIVLKLDKKGNLEWIKDYGTNGADYGYSIKQLNNGDYLLFGFSKSKSTIDKDYYSTSDIWIKRINNKGDIIWEKKYGGSDCDCLYNDPKLSLTIDGGYIFTGTTSSKDGDITFNHSNSFEGWLVKIDINGNIKFQRTFGGSGWDSFSQAHQTKDKGYIITGTTYSSDGDVTENKGDSDGWIIKLGVHYQPIDTVTATFSIVAPQPAAIDVDMGKVYVGEWRDSTVAEFVYNIGDYKFRVDSIYIRGADKTAFSLIGGFPKYNVEPDSSKPAKFKFTPTREGMHYANIVIVTQTDTLIQNIWGEGLKKRAQILVQLEPFIDLICDNSTTSTLLIKSIGTDTLRIKELNLTGSDKADFSINEPLPINLPPDSTKTITIGFKTNIPGIKTAALEIKSNADPDSVITIPLNARKDSIALVPSPTLIDLGTLFPNQTKDTSFIISNLGTIKTDGKVTFTSNISCANPTFTIDSGGVYKLDFTFTGLSAEGNINEKITVWDEVCKYSRDVLITGKVVSPHLLGFSAIQCKSYSNEYKLTLQNPSSNRLKITSIVFAKNPQLFEIDPSLVFPITIEPYKTNYEVKVKYKDDIAQNFKTVVNCSTDNKFIPVLTDTIYAETVEYIRTTSGLINDSISDASNPFAVSYDSESQNGKNKFIYSIQINESANDMDYLTELSDLEVVINYNRNVLGADFDSETGKLIVRLSNDISANYTIISAKESKIDEFNSQIIVLIENTGKPITKKDAYKLLEIDFSAYLSKENLSNEQNSPKSRNAIISHSITTTDECITYEMANNAYLDIEKLCVDDMRSIKLPADTTAKFYLANVIPHPIGTEGATIEYGLGFECQVTLKIYNISGAVVLTPINEIQKAGTHKLAISSKSLSAGAYFIEMKAGPFKETKRVIVE